VRGQESKPRKGKGDLSGMSTGRLYIGKRLSSYSIAGNRREGLSRDSILRKKKKGGKRG